jgi:uncharacterized repeat protein (TIGR03803 family)
MNVAASKCWWRRLRLIALGAAQVLVLQTAFAVQITTTSLPDATQGSFYAHQLKATNGVAPYQWSLSSGSGPLPTGLLLVTNGGIFSGFIYGAPSVSGTFYFFARVTDASDATADQAISLTIRGNGGPPNPVTLRTLHVFDPTEGLNPIGELAQGGDGELYGICSFGVYVVDGTLVAGSGFRSTTNGLITSNWFSQMLPDGGFTEGPDGNLYGTSLDLYDGVSSFELTTNGSVKVLCSFEETEPYSSNQPAFYAPPPAFGLAGDLFGVTSWGGLSNSGVVYRIDSNGVFATLYSFTGGRDGANPQTALTSDGSGSFYGTTSQGGVSNQGTIFRITADGDFESLYSFTGRSDGGNPASELLYTASGLLYGTTPSGGVGGFGTVFEIDANGVLTTLYSFAGHSDGEYPVGKLVQGLDGNLYGTTKQGGDSRGGTIYRITTGGMLTTLYGFHGVDAFPAIPNPSPIPLHSYLPSGGNDGSSPSGVLQGTDGSLYGTTIVGGYSNYGTIFRLDINPAPTVDLVAGRLIAATNALTFSVPYPTVELIWGATNQGTGPAPGGWWDQVWVSTNGVFDSHSISAGAFYNNQTLAPGAGYQVTNIVSLPIAASGTYTLFVQANAYGQIYEINTNNNLTGPVSLSFTLRPPDLAPISVAASETWSAWGNLGLFPAITVSWCVTNQGAGLAHGGWWDQLWLSTNGVLDSNSVSIASFNDTNDLPAGESIRETNTVMQFWSGPHITLFLEVNSSQSIFESNYSNNFSGAIPVTTTIPDLAVVSASAAPTNLYSSQPNPKVEVSWTVTNQESSLATGTWYDWVWLSETNGSPISVGMFPAPGPLSPGASYSQTHTVSLPLSVSGDYTVFVESGVTGDVYETNSANNLSAPVPITFTLAPPDLAIVSASAPREILSVSNFTPITVTWAVTNRGLGTAPGGWGDLVSYSPNNGIIIIGGPGNPLYVTHPADLPAGGSYIASTTILLSSSTFGSAGSARYVLTVHVDPYPYSFFESDYSNNVSQPLTVNITPVTPPTVIALSDSLLRIYGTAGIAYEVDYKPTDSTTWQPLALVPMTHSPQTLSAPPGANSAWQYRANVLNADPPILDARLDGQGRSLVLFGLPTYNYTLQYATNISASTTWQAMFDYTLTNSFLFVTNPAGTSNGSVFYRIVEH